MTILLAVIVTALLALTTSVVWAGRVFLRSSESRSYEQLPAPTSTESVESTAVADELRQKIADLTIAVSEGIKSNERHEKRVQRTVASARRLVGAAGLEHAALDAEVAELREGDAAPLEEPLLPLQPLLELDGPSGIPGLSKSELRARRGA